MLDSMYIIAMAKMPSKTRNWQYTGNSASLMSDMKISCLCITSVLSDADISNQSNVSVLSV